MISKAQLNEELTLRFDSMCWPNKKQKKVNI